MNWGEEQLLVRALPADQGPGNALMLSLEYEHATEVFAAFGAKSVTSEQVARQVVQRAPVPHVPGVVRRIPGRPDDAPARAGRRRRLYAGRGVDAMRAPTRR